MNLIENLPNSSLETYLTLILQLIYVSCQIVDSTKKMSLKIERAKLFENKQQFSFLCLGTSKTLSLGEFDEP